MYREQHAWAQNQLAYYFVPHTFEDKKSAGDFSDNFSTYDYQQAHRNYGTRNQKRNRSNPAETKSKNLFFDPYFYTGVSRLWSPVFSVQQV